MKYDQCTYSGRQVIGLSPLAERHPIECPACSVIRQGIWDFGQPVFYPAHNELQGTSRERRRWKQVEGEWVVIGEDPIKKEKRT